MDKMMKSLKLLESLGFISDEPNDDWRPVARFWDVKHNELFTIPILFLYKPALLKRIINAAYRHKLTNKI